MEKDQKEREVIKHFNHPHPLVLNEDQSNQSKEACCNGCLEPLFGPCFSCVECSQFHLHKKCAQAPLQITNSPFHRKHPTLTLKSSIYVYCDLCKESRNMFSYWCSTNCGACLDIKCAFLFHNIDGSFHEIKYGGHQHPLTFFENPNDELKTASCYWCQKPLIGSVYVCLNCRFYLHKKCVQLPTQLAHPWHRKHSLFIEDGHFVCKLCERDDWSLFYRCLPCKFDIDIECVMSKASCPTTVEDKSHHEHPFTRLLRDGSFVCDACGTEGNYVSYMCSLCDIMIHKKCISLPCFIKIPRHHHNMIHNYFFQKKELESHACGICLSEVKAEYGSYNCLKQDCNYVVHVNCATEDEDLFRVIDQDEVADEENSKNVESSITDIVEVNAHGGAVKIKHFSHQHCLMLGGKISGDDDDGKQCDGCVGFILDSFFYYCRECDFILHKACVELPRRKLLWFHQSPTTLNLGGIFRCGKCYRLCSGFFYEKGRHSYWDEYQFCIRCATISHTLKCEEHEHPLFFDFKFQGKCNGCGYWCKGAYKCKDCPFALNFACITLPKAIGHKSDEHIFKLAFHDRMDDESEVYYCDICEEKRDPNLWFYYCAVCDNSAHPKCALEKYPFVKMKTETAFPYSLHPHFHPLFFVKALYDTCSVCHRPCVDVALKCTYPKCNYIIHLDHCKD
ncbi:hypothetical protein PTKIN_Ptkin16aG0105600 [Pterospermum kingtungense]